jgi:hypothetical protein
MGYAFAGRSLPGTGREQEKGNEEHADLPAMHGGGPAVPPRAGDAHFPIPLHSIWIAMHGW